MLDRAMRSAEARAIFRRFRALPGSEQIATEYALVGLANLLRRQRPKRILEIGAGLGTLSALLLRAPPATYWVLERDAGYRSAWDENVGRARYAVTKVTELPRADAVSPFDLVVIDDRLQDPFPAAFLARRAVCYFEGNRGPERGLVAVGLARAHRRAAWLNRRPWDRSKGFWIAACEPTVWERMRFALGRAGGGLLDLIVCRLTGRAPGWRRRDVDPNA